MTDKPRRKSRAKPINPDDVIERERAVQVLLSNPELSLRGCKEQFQLKTSISTLNKYRRRIQNGEEPWMTGPGGGRQRARTTARDGLPVRSVEVEAAINTRKIAEGLAEVAAQEAATETGEPLEDMLGMKEGDVKEPQDLTQTVKPPIAKNDVTPKEVSRKAATARRQALEKLNLQAASVGSQALDILRKLLTDPERVQQLKAKDLAVVSSIAIDRFLTTAASMESITGDSGVPGALDYFDENNKDFGERRIKGERELKRILKVVRWHNTPDNSEYSDSDARRDKAQLKKKAEK